MSADVFFRESSQQLQDQKGYFKCMLLTPNLIETYHVVEILQIGMPDTTDLTSDSLLLTQTTWWRSDKNDLIKVSVSVARP